MTEPVQREADYDAIASHDRVAKAYHFRLPYGASFFEKIAQGIGLGPESLVLDLCCGRGTVATGLAAHCKAADAVDGAPDMIARAQQAPNVAYHLFNVGSPEYRDWARGKRYDLISIGMGVHWLDDAAIAGLREQLRPGGRIVTLATQFSGSKLNPWFPEFQAVRDEYIPRLELDWSGRKQLLAAGFGRSRPVKEIYIKQIPVSFLAMNMMSYARGYQKVVDNFALIVAALEERLAPFTNDGMLECYWENWARVFDDQKSTAIPLSTQSP
jgi:SAM-dependent methyltransferase